MLTIECKICGEKIRSIDFLDHLKEAHDLSGEEYFEIVNLGSLKNKCCGCGSYRSLVSLKFPGDYVIPCKTCSGSDTPLKTYENFLEDLLGDKYYSSILINPEWIRESQSHDSKVLRDLLKKELPKISKNSWISIDFKPWALKEISERNLESLIIQDHQDLFCKKISSVIYKITTPFQKDFFLEFPERCKYDIRHHPRYNIFNLKSYSRHVKKLKFPDGGCIKFWDSFSKDHDIKAIFKLTTSSGDRVNISELPPRTKNFIRMIILRDKFISDELKRILLEISRHSGGIYDNVLADGYIDFQVSKKPIFSLVWDSLDSPPEDNIIKLGIL